MKTEDLKRIQEVIGGYKFKNLYLLKQAFIRKSYSQEHGGANNEVLEYIGDAMLSSVVAKKLTFSDELGYGRIDTCENNHDLNSGCKFYCCKFNEQRLTEIKNKLVCKEMLSKCISELNLQQYLIMGKGDIEQNLQNRDSVKEDLFEAILGALAVDSRFDMLVIEHAVDIMLDPVRRINNEILGRGIDYINCVNQWHAKANGGILPEIIYEDGQLAPWNSLINNEVCITSACHRTDCKFSCRLIMKISGNEIKFRGFGNSKSQARKDVYILAYNYLSEKKLLFTIKDEIDKPSRNDSIGQLEILAQRGYFTLPKYKYSQTYDKNGNPVWKAECYIDGKEYYSASSSSSKKEAKKNAAWKMLQYLLNI